MSSGTEFKFYSYDITMHAEKAKRLKKKFTIDVAGCDIAMPLDLIERSRTDQTPSSKFEFEPEQSNFSRTYLIEYRGEIYALHVIFKIYSTGTTIPKVSECLHNRDGFIACYNPDEERTYSVCAQKITTWAEHMLGSTKTKPCFVIAYGKKNDKQKKMESKLKSVPNQVCCNFDHETLSRDLTSTTSVIQKIIEKLVFQFGRASECADSSDDSDSSDDY